MDALLYWNEVALEANKHSHTTGKDSVKANGPTMSSRVLAMVHLSMYDAYIGTVGTNPGSINSTLNAYLGAAKAAVPSSETAAIGAAAFTVLSKIYPSQMAFFEEKLMLFSPDGSSDQIYSGHKYGQLIAEKIMELRKNDTNADSNGYTPHLTHGTHRQDPWDNKQGYHGAFYGKNALFSSTRRYKNVPPPPTNSNNVTYMRAYNQVRGLGIIPEQAGMLPKGSLKRSSDETLAGIFWAYDGAKELGTPPRLYNQIIRKIAIENKNSLEDNIELFTLINVAMGDAGILAWDEKYRFNYWRPVVGIREHDTSMGPLGQPALKINNDSDPLWLPLGAPNSNNQGSNNASPGFPAYPSGHATFGAATFRIAELFFKEKGTDFDSLFEKLSFVSDEFNGKTKDNRGIIRPRHNRKFDNFDDMIIENGLSRVYLGVHWSFDAFPVSANANKKNTPSEKGINNNEVDLTFDLSNPNDEVGLGGVPLGLAIAEDIFNNGLRKSNV